MITMYKWQNKPAPPRCKRLNSSYRVKDKLKRVN